MDLLSMIYNGEYSPKLTPHPQTAEYTDASDTCKFALNTLHEVLTDEQRTLLDQYTQRAAWLEHLNLTEAFCMGAKFGIQLMQESKM